MILNAFFTMNITMHTIFMFLLFTETPVAYRLPAYILVTTILKFLFISVPCLACSIKINIYT